MVHWPLMGGLLHLVQRGEAWADKSPPRCTKYNSHPSTASVPTLCCSMWQLPLAINALMRVRWATHPDALQSCKTATTTLWNKIRRSHRRRGRKPPNCSRSVCKCHVAAWHSFRTVTRVSVCLVPTSLLDYGNGCPLCRTPTNIVLRFGPHFPVVHFIFIFIHHNGSTVQYKKYLN